MSIFNEDEKLSKIFDYEEDNNFSPLHLEDAENFPFFKNSKEESHSSYTLSDKGGNPLFINNENFINYFMHIDYNTPLNNEYINISSSQSISGNPPKETKDSIEININDNHSNNNDNNILLKKTKREKEYGVITDNLTGITYYEKDDPVTFKKAKKRIQNRESALRMKKLRENNINKLDEEMSRLKEDNIRLINENISLKQEKIFLIDQIKFMQKIIKESNLEFKLKNTTNNIFNENENKNKEQPGYYGGSKQKIKGKLFNVFVVCILSIVYIAGECSYDCDNSKIGGKKDRNNGHSMHLNSVKNKEKNKNSGIFWLYFSKIILFLIFFFIVPFFKDIIEKIMELVNKRKRKKYI